MNYAQLVEGLNNGTIKVDRKGHRMNDPVERIQDNLVSWTKHMNEYKDKLARGITKDGNVTCEGMIEFYEKYKMGEIRIGNYTCDSEHYCFDCDSRMYGVLIGDTLTFIEMRKFWDLRDQWAKEHPGKNKYSDFPGFTMDQVEECSCKELNQVKKLTTTIDCPSGVIIFKNYFKKNKLYDWPAKREYKKPSINSLLGRDKLMQHLAKYNVGYGQMGNMSVTIYSNNRDEVLVGSSMESYYDNKHWYEKHPEQEAEDERWVRQKADAEEFIKIIEDGGFEELGHISLEVWRWMCADKQVLDEENEKITGKKNNETYYSDYVETKVQPGKYQIDHFYDFRDSSDYFYSRIKLVS